MNPHYLVLTLTILSCRLRAIYRNLNKFHYTYGSGNLDIILKPVGQNEDFYWARI